MRGYWSILGQRFQKTKPFGSFPIRLFARRPKQSDIISDIVQLNPTHLILIDGEFSQNLSVWTKELMYALIFPSLGGRVYGASSMGALRGADVAD